MKEKEDFCGVGVAFGESEKVEVGMANVKVLKETEGSAFLLVESCMTLTISGAPLLSPVRGTADVFRL